MTDLLRTILQIIGLGTLVAVGGLAWLWWKDGRTRSRGEYLRDGSDRG